MTSSERCIYQDFFSGEGYDITLDITEAGMFDSYNYLYNGTMKIKFKSAVQNFKIHGKVAKL